MDEDAANDHQVDWCLVHRPGSGFLPPSR
jgi:hypothetical protein